MGELQGESEMRWVPEAYGHGLATLGQTPSQPIQPWLWHLLPKNISKRTQNEAICAHTNLGLPGRAVWLLSQAPAPCWGLCKVGVVCGHAQSTEPVLRESALLTLPIEGVHALSLQTCPSSSGQSCWEQMSKYSRTTNPRLTRSL